MYRPHADAVESALAKLKGDSERMKTFRADLRALADLALDVPVRLGGESGSGKELVVEVLHAVWGSKGQRVAVSCAELMDDVSTISAICGHERNAFTGANAPRLGALRSAEGGTVFFDEFGDLRPGVQPIFLRALESRTAKPLGSDVAFPFRAHLIFCTNIDLEDMVEQGQLREELYHRIYGVEVIVPPLRERRSDIPLLCEDVLSRWPGGRRIRVGPEALAMLMAHDWPGNVRELVRTLQRAVVNARGAEVIRPEHIKFAPLRRARKRARDLHDPNVLELRGLTFREGKRQLMEKALQRHGGCVAAAARELEVDESTLRRFKSSAKDAEPVPDEP